MYKKVSPEIFELSLNKIDHRGSIKKDRNYKNKTCYLDLNSESGFALTSCGQLCHVFSCKKGMGSYAVLAAIELGANRLSCYNDKLEKYYKNFGFMTAVKEKAGEIDKFWMVKKNVRGPVCL